VFYAIIQDNTWRIYRRGWPMSILSGFGEIETAIEIARLYGYVLTEFYNLPVLRAA